MRQLKSFFWRHNKYLTRYLLKYLHAKYSTPIFEADSWGWSLQTYEVKESGLSNLRSLDKTRFSTWERKQWLCRVGRAKWPIICKLSSSLCWLLKEKMVTKEIWKLKRLVLKQQKITWEEQYLLKRIYLPTGGRCSVSHIVRVSSKSYQIWQKSRTPRSSDMWDPFTRMVAFI